MDPFHSQSRVALESEKESSLELRGCDSLLNGIRKWTKITELIELNASYIGSQYSFQLEPQQVNELSPRRRTRRRGRRIFRYKPDRSDQKIWRILGFHRRCHSIQVSWESEHSNDHWEIWKFAQRHARNWEAWGLTLWFMSSKSHNVYGMVLEESSHSGFTSIKRRSFGVKFAQTCWAKMILLWSI